MNHCRQWMCVTLAAAVVVALPCASTYGWSVVETHLNTSWVTSGSDVLDDAGGCYSHSWSSQGAYGVYTGYCKTVTARRFTNWYNRCTGLCTLDGWRKKQIDHCNETDTASYNWEVDLGVELSGEFYMDNDLAPVVWPLGDNKAIGDAYIILTGLGTALGNVKGTMTAEEGCGTASVAAGGIGLDLPIDLEGDASSFYGDSLDTTQTLSSSGTKPNAVKGHHIRIRGFVKTYSECHDAALSSEITCKTLLPTFTLTPN